jgi:hypothetical protein
MNASRLALRCLLAAAVAALLAWPVAAIVAPALGSRAALAAHVALAAALALAALAPSPRRAAGLAVLAGACVGAAAWLSGSASVVIVAGAVALGLGRSALLFRGRPLRALATEALFLGAGLWLATRFGGRTWGGVALGTWIFLLVQSAWPLVGGGPSPRVDDHDSRDPFEVARERLARALDAA